MRQWRAPLIIMILLLSGCSVFDFDQYDYDTHENAHIDVRGMDARVDKVKGGLLVGRKFKFGQPKHIPYKAKKKQENRNERLTF